MACIGGMMRNWILSNMGPTLDLARVPMQEDYDGSCGRNLGPQHHKILRVRGDVKRLNAANATWLGGICTLFTADGERIRKGETTFDSVDHFEMWMRGWYPRLDQVHDCMGVPPRECRRAVYVVEDSIFGRRIAKWTGLDPILVAQAIRRVHEEYGKPAIKAWLRCFGWGGEDKELKVVYTSDLEDQLEFAFRMLKRQTGRKIKNGKIDTAKVELMYTGAWLDILGVSIGVISEPVHHGLEGVIKNPFEDTGLYQLGFLPFWSPEGATRYKPLEQVTHRGNWRSFAAQGPWDAVNLQFTAKRPFNFDPTVLQDRCMRDLVQVFGIEEEAARNSA